MTTETVQIPSTSLSQLHSGSVSVVRRIVSESNQNRGSRITSFLKKVFSTKSTSQPVRALSVAPGAVTLFNAANNVAIGNSTFIVNLGSHYHTTNTITGVILVDAAGKDYQVPMGFATSFETFSKAIALLLEGNAIEARVQREFLRARKYTLTIDRGTETVTIRNQEDWATQVHPGTKIVLSVVLTWSFPSRRYRCPRCNTWNTVENGQGDNAAVDCQGCYARFQLSEAMDLPTVQLKGDTVAVRHEDRRMLRNFCWARSRPKASGAEFNAAITYINTMKSRLHDKPGLYKSFLDTLHDFSQNLYGAAPHVENLLKDYPELIEGFKSFLPNQGSALIEDEKE